MMIRCQFAAFAGYHILSICPTLVMLIFITLSNVFQFLQCIITAFSFLKTHKQSVRRYLKFDLLLFSFLYHAFGDVSEKSLPNPGSQIFFLCFLLSPSFWRIFAMNIEFWIVRTFFFSFSSRILKISVMLWHPLLLVSCQSPFALFLLLVHLGFTSLCCILKSAPKQKARLKSGLPLCVSLLLYIKVLNCSMPIVASNNLSAITVFHDKRVWYQLFHHAIWRILTLLVFLLFLQSTNETINNIFLKTYYKTVLVIKDAKTWYKPLTSL